MAQPKHKTATLKVADLVPFHANPRIGNVAQIKASLEAFGQFKTIVVNVGTHTGRPNEILAGNHTYKAAVELGWTTLTATLVDVDDDTAKKIVLADNRSADLADYDDDLLLELLQSLPDLDGTGYEGEDVSELLAELEASMPKTVGLDGLDRNTGPRTETAPTSFQSYDTDLPTDYSCPRCSYSWSGKPKGEAAPSDDE